MIKSVRLLLLLGLLGLTACAGIFTPAALTPSVPPITPTVTPTIVWFPATDTPIPLPTPTIAATVEQLAGVGNLLFADGFTQASLWSTAASGQASAVVQPGRLVLSITAPGPLTILSLRSEPALADFYAEATASLSLCQGDDEYGMLFRAAPGDNYYRFTVSCRGQVRLERALSGSVMPLQDWSLTGDAPLGAPAQVRLGVWAVGSEMRFFLNGAYQFTARDPTLHLGTLGFFISASGSTPVTAAFSDLSAYTVTYVSPTPTLIPSQTALSSRVPTP
jgi:hypothetical protein